MKSKVLASGAEATIFKTGSVLIKDRIAKSYRHPKLDEKLRKQRTKSELKLLEKAANIIPVPQIMDSLKKSKEDYKISLSYIHGKKLSQDLEKLNYSSICKQIGSSLAKLHDAGIIHGDLTTSNLILKEKTVYFIDFGLGFHSNRIEDKAVDLHLIKQALEAKHPTIFEKSFRSILLGYKTSKNYSLVLERLKKVEKRGRYKAQY